MSAAFMAHYVTLCHIMLLSVSFCHFMAEYVTFCHFLSHSAVCSSAFFRFFIGELQEIFLTSVQFLYGFSTLAVHFLYAFSTLSLRRPYTLAYSCPGLLRGISSRSKSCVGEESDESRSGCRETAEKVKRIRRVVCWEENLKLIQDGGSK
jgi:hypothetical protein